VLPITRSASTLRRCWQPIADASDFLERPAIEAITSPATESPSDSLVGRRIGAYRILRQLGRGGMGAVYLAERADEQFRKQVAIKLVKHGMDSDAILHRFRSERQILASLDHPHIATLLDAGTTDDGLSFFIMEYVEGQPIDVYCTTHGLSTRERLQLFGLVCTAVQHAHEHQVVHRDLKPSNILVTDAGVRSCSTSASPSCSHRKTPGPWRMRRPSACVR